MVKTTVGIEGMMCEKCEARMAKALKDGLKIKKAEASHKTGSAVLISDGELDAEQIKQIVTDTGYTFTEVKTEPYKKGLFG